jgi:hypothetical protein
VIDLFLSGDNIIAGFRHLKATTVFISMAKLVTLARKSYQKCGMCFDLTVAHTVAVLPSLFCDLCQSGSLKESGRAIKMTTFGGRPVLRRGSYSVCRWWWWW